MNTFKFEAEVGNKNRFQRSCVDCHTTRTPLWRGGPAGPRSLCNACGIRYRKRKRGLLALGGEESAEKKKRKSDKSIGRDKRLVRIMVGKEWKRKLREEEEAAILLLALSCGAVYA